MEMTAHWAGIPLEDCMDVDYCVVKKGVDLTEEEKLLNRRMMKYWANFAKHGFTAEVSYVYRVVLAGETVARDTGWHIHRNPNSEGLPYWPMMDEDEQYLQLDIQPAVG
ncbi:hypothetical protein U0070_006876 [Myodes glareolus]|uniref:Carboxylesterase type B domain-containing protein n=1 Tax=Myodes glareolus TaxID=447135 RepID=A0AAW0HSA1_MYOGA